MRGAAVRTVEGLVRAGQRARGRDGVGVVEEGRKLSAAVRVEFHKELLAVGVRPVQLILLDIEIAAARGRVLSVDVRIQRVLLEAPAAEIHGAGPVRRVGRAAVAVEGHLEGVSGEGVVLQRDIAVKRNVRLVRRRRAGTAVAVIGDGIGVLRPDRIDRFVVADVHGAGLAGGCGSVLAPALEGVVLIGRGGGKRHGAVLVGAHGDVLGGNGRIQRDAVAVKGHLGFEVVQRVVQIGRISIDLGLAIAAVHAGQRLACVGERGLQRNPIISILISRVEVAAGDIAAADAVDAQRGHFLDRPLHRGAQVGLVAVERIQRHHGMSACVIVTAPTFYSTHIKTVNRVSIRSAAGHIFQGPRPHSGITQTFRFIIGCAGRRTVRLRCNDIVLFVINSVSVISVCRPVYIRLC